MLLADLQVLKEDMASEMSAFVELPLRYEPQLVHGPYTTLKAGITSAGVVTAAVEHTIAAGSEYSGKVEVVASVDAWRDENEVAVSYSMQG